MNTNMTQGTTATPIRFDREFDSIETFLKAASRPVAGGIFSCYSSARTQSEKAKEFTHTDSLEEAMRLAKEGWAGGREQAEKIRAEIVDSVRGSFGERQVAQWDVAGADVDIGRFVVGEPENMIDFASEIVPMQSTKIVRMAVNFGASAASTPADLIRRGVIAAVAIDIMESRGIRVEVDAVKIASQYKDGTGGIISARIRLKSAEEPLDLDRMIFVLGHPSFLRRIWFAYLESEAGFREAISSRTVKVGRGGSQERLVLYGYPHNEVAPADDIYIPANQSWTQDGAASAIVEMLAGAGIDLSE